MKFSVIYSIDALEGESGMGAPVTPYYPRPSIRKLMTVTEKGDTDNDVEFPFCKHRKLVALFTRAQFDKFIEDTSLVPENCETMGSIGAPGFGWGWAPAISFNGASYDAMCNAYVTPIPELKKEVLTERDWQRVRKAVIKFYS